MIIYDYILLRYVNDSQELIVIIYCRLYLRLYTYRDHTKLRLQLKIHVIA